LKFRKKKVSGIVLTWVVAVSAAFAQGASTDREVIDSTRATLAKWVEAQQIIAKEKEDWDLAKEVLSERISLVDGEIASLREKIGQTREAIGEADSRRSEITRENEDLEAASAHLASGAGGLETKTRQLLASIPEPLRERVEPLARRIPADPANSQLSLGERYVTVLAILNEVNKFNRDTLVLSEIRELPGGVRAEVKTLYIGLGAAYYVTPNGDAAGVGHPTPAGWVWTPANELAPDIARAIAIWANEEVPAFVPLPVKIR
jgi:hypothetical protein